MNEIKLSTFMEYIMSYANERKEAASATTVYVEHIYCAALYVISQNKTVSPIADLPFDDNEIKRVSELLRSRSTNLEAALAELEKYADADESPVSQRVLAKSKALISARKRAQINNLSTIGADMILQCILDSPTEGIKTHIIEGKPFTAVPSEETKPVQKTVPEPEGEGKERIKNLIIKTKNIRDILLDKIFGQDNAVNVFSTGFFQSEMLAMTDKKRKRPRATFLFAGPPGVGKTFLAECAAEIVYYGENDGISTGASGDLDYATGLATDMICRYGMIEEFGLAAILPSSDISDDVLKAVNSILCAELDKAISIITDNMGATDALVAELVSKNQLSSNEIESIIAPSFNKTNV